MSTKAAPLSAVHVDAIAGRLRAHAEAHEYIANADKEQMQWMEDLYDAADEIERLRTDVERYRWLRLRMVVKRNSGCPDRYGLDEFLLAEGIDESDDARYIDAAIDAALNY